MRKVLTIFLILFIILSVFAEFIVPHLAESALQKEIVKRASSYDVQITLDSTPRALISLGRIGTVRGVLHDGQIGELQVSELTLEGEEVQLDLPMLISEQRLLLNSARRLELKGIVTEDNLKNLLSRKVDRLENLEVTMTPEEVKATANLKIMGRMADVDLTGILLADGGELYFRMKKLNIRNALFRHIEMDNYFGDIQITDPETLPFGFRFEEVTMQDGKTLVRAVRPNAANFE